MNLIHCGKIFDIVFLRRYPLELWLSRIFVRFFIQRFLMIVFKKSSLEICLNSLLKLGDSQNQSLWQSYILDNSLYFFGFFYYFQWKFIIQLRCLVIIKLMIFILLLVLNSIRLKSLNSFLLLYLSWVK
jgi:hypothetical protein